MKTKYWFLWHFRLRVSVLEAFDPLLNDSSEIADQGKFSF